MARALARGGHQLVLYNRTPGRAERLAADIGAQVAPTPARAAGQADVIITMVADDAALTELCKSDEGILAGAQPGSVTVQCSTVLPDTVRALAPIFSERGLGFLDAPVSGSIALAEQGKLTVMAGGDAAALEKARPVLEALAGRVFHMGPVGTGAAMKLAVNAVIFALDVALAEALVLAERAGIERERAYEVLEASAAGAPFVAYKRQAFVDPESAPTAFSLDLAGKDLRLIAALASALGLPVAQARTNLDLIDAAAQSQGPERDFAFVAGHLRNVQ